MKDLPDTDPIAELRANVAEPFERARAMPPGVYTSEAVRAAELERTPFGSSIRLIRPAIEERTHHADVARAAPPQALRIKSGNTNAE